MQCGEAGFYQLSNKPVRVDKHGSEYPFCPGKTSWSPKLRFLFTECLVAFTSGIMPRPGTLEEQDELFYNAFPIFVEKFTWRRYGRVWQDVGEVIPKVLEAIAKMFGGKKGR